MIDIYLPWPPTVNSYYAVVGSRHGARRISKNGVAFRAAINQAIHEQLNDPPNLDVRLCVKCLLHPPDARTRDLDNYMKALLDALTHAHVWVDDSLIDQLLLYRGSISSKGFVRMLIEDAGPLLPNHPDIFKIIK